jgi:glycosyltransferase involved in cell wall biosynthesis
MPKFTPAIYYHPDAIETKGKPLVGRRSSGQSFMKGFLRHIEGDSLSVAASTKAHAQQFLKHARAMGDKRPVKFYSAHGTQPYQEPGSFFFPGPGFMEFNWCRLRQNPKMCSLIGITHTVSTRRIVKSLHGIVSEPVEDWDAIICTSSAVQSVVARQMEEEVAYFTKKFEAKRVVLPQLPIIPLGINTDDFHHDKTARGEARKKYKVADGETVLLCVGRQSSVEKAHPVPLYQAAQEAAAKVDHKIHIWMVGWSGNKHEAGLHKKSAKSVAPDVNIVFIDGQDPWNRARVWSGADVFTLPSDSIQETFGLVPVEAMAAGLPVIMPNWDGFRDTVINGVTGIMIPTRMAPPGDGAKFSMRYMDGSDGYLNHLAIAQQHVQIDVSAYRDAIIALAKNPDLRSKMGIAGAKHASSTLDWSAIIPQYQALSNELEQRRKSAVEPSIVKGGGHAVSPIEIDPFELYKAYPSHDLREDDVISIKNELNKENLTELLELSSVKIYKRLIAQVDEILETFNLINSGMSVNDLMKVSKIAPHQTRGVILYLAKFNYLELNEK